MSKLDYVMDVASEEISRREAISEMQSGESDYSEYSVYSDYSDTGYCVVLD